MAMGTSYHNSDPALDYLSEFDESGMSFKDFHSKLVDEECGDDSYSILGLVHCLVNRGYKFSNDEQATIGFLMHMEVDHLLEIGVNPMEDEQWQEFTIDLRTHLKACV